MAVLLDASFVLAIDNQKDVHHKKARDLLKKISEEESFYISDYIFDEIISVTMRKLNKERALVLGQKMIESLPILNIDQHMFEEAWKIYKQNSFNLSFTDCTNLVVLKLLNQKRLATFDKEFAKIKDIEIIS